MPLGNGQSDEPIDVELDLLVNAEAEAVARVRQEPIEQLLARLAARLREHADRAALLDRLVADVTGAAPEIAPAPVPAPEPPPHQD